MVCDVVSCSELEEYISFDCCQSCHEDLVEFNVPMIELDFKGKSFHICCKASIAVDEELMISGSK